MNKAELSKMSKANIIESITSYGFMFRQAVEEKESKEKQLIEQSLNENAAKLMLASFVGKEVEFAVPTTCRKLKAQFN